MCEERAKMPPTTTIPAPVQKSHQVGPMGSAIPPTMKPATMIETATQETGRPWCVACVPCCGPMCASSPCPPVLPTVSMAPDATCTATESSSPRYRSYYSRGSARLVSSRPLMVAAEHPGPAWRAETVRLGLVPHLAYDDIGGGEPEPVTVTGRDEVRRSARSATRSGTDHR